MLLKANSIGGQLSFSRKIIKFIKQGLNKSPPKVQLNFTVWFNYAIHIVMNFLFLGLNKLELKIALHLNCILRPILVAVEVVIMWSNLE